MGILKEYMLQSSLHGVKYVVNGEQYSRIERFFWTICVALSWVGSVFLIKASLETYNNNAISFVVESNYLDWDTDFPSVFICEAKNMDRVQEVADEIFGEDHDFTLEEILSEIAYFQGESYHIIDECAGDSSSNDNCLVGNYSYYANLVRNTCESSMAECSFNGKPFDCCKHFTTIDTEVGRCYALNSGQTTKPPNHKPLNVKSNRFTGPGFLKFKNLVDCFLYTIGHHEVPHLTTPKADILQINLFQSFRRQLTMKNVENELEVHDVSIEQRNCRFPEENYIQVHEFYSFSACSVQCRKDEQIKLCACNSHVIPNTDVNKHCDINGLVCLNQHLEDLSTIIAPWSDRKKRKGIVCDCMPSCNEVDMWVSHDSMDNILDSEDDPHSWVELSLANLPTERYMRKVVFGKLDLVVSIGGSTGLFVGASLLSFVEIIYYFTIRAGFFNFRNVFKQRFKVELQQD